MTSLSLLLFQNGLPDLPVVLIEPHRNSGGIWRIKVNNPIAGSVDADAAEPNESTGDFEVFDLSEDFDGDDAPELDDRTIHYADDHDFYKVTAEHTGNLIVSLYFAL